ncbi:hypothetical protein ACOME3_008425 [Neoechinorhynchus agilis]
MIDNEAIKYVSQCWHLTTPILLILQNSFMTLVVRHMKLRKSYSFMNTTAVFWTEIIKLKLSLILIALNHSSFSAFQQTLRQKLFSANFTTLKSFLPALLYSFQNNLLYIAMGNLDAATFQVSYQLKILTTAACMWLILGKRLSFTQWIT